jgi:hypothetical protein
MGTRMDLAVMGLPLVLLPQGRPVLLVVLDQSTS